MTHGKADKKSTEHGKQIKKLKQWDTEPKQVSENCHAEHWINDTREKADKKSTEPNVINTCSTKNGPPAGLNATLNHIVWPIITETMTHWT